MNLGFCQPLIFDPVYKDYLWGGRQISVRYKRNGTPVPCAESWEISTHPDGQSIVSQGLHRGKSLEELALQYGAELMGNSSADPYHFPLLFKIIDTNLPLSVQVHPNQRNAWRTNGEPKTESWVILDAVPSAKIYAGLKRGTDERMLREALANDRVPDLLMSLSPTPEYSIYIPGGSVHAIGAGCLIYEVQRNSNTTYRLYDWDRVDKNGNRRALHIEESLKSIDWSLPVPRLHAPVPAEKSPGAQWFNLVRCPYFSIRKLRISAPYRHLCDATTFSVFFVSLGTVRLTSGGETVRIPTGRSALVPAAAPEWRVEPEDGVAEVLVSRL